MPGRWSARMATATYIMRAHRKVPQIGNVIVGDDVEIGANVTIDRGALGPTVIGKGSKIDNLVQIAHNVRIGEHCIVIAQVALRQQQAGQLRHSRRSGGPGWTSSDRQQSHRRRAIRRHAQHPRWPDRARQSGAPDKQTKRQLLALQRLPNCSAASASWKKNWASTDRIRLKICENKHHFPLQPLSWLCHVADLVIGGCLAFAQQTNAPPPLAELQQRLTRTSHPAALCRRVFGVKVVSLDTGKTLFENDATKLLSPASNCKIYTMAMVLDKLGGDYRIKTSLYASVKPDKRGNLKGDSSFMGAAIPGSTSRRATAIFFARCNRWSALTNAGVRKISGDLDRGRKLHRRFAVRFGLGVGRHELLLRRGNLGAHHQRQYAPGFREARRKVGAPLRNSPFRPPPATSS
jgi:hypothetical protein